MVAVVSVFVGGLVAKIVAVILIVVVLAVKVSIDLLVEDGGGRAIIDRCSSSPCC